MEWPENPGPNQALCAECGRSVLVRVVITRADRASDVNSDNTRAVCANCWREVK